MHPRESRVFATSLEGIPFLFVGNTMWPASQFVTAPFTRVYDMVFGFWLIVGLITGYWLMWPLTPRTWPLFIAWGLPFVALCVTVPVPRAKSASVLPFDVWLTSSPSQRSGSPSTAAKRRRFGSWQGTISANRHCRR